MQPLQSQNGPERRLTTTISRKLKALERIAAGEKAKDVAAACGVDRATVWRWEKQREAIEAAKPNRVGEKKQTMALSAETEQK